MTDTAVMERAPAPPTLDRAGPAIPYADGFSVRPPRRSTAAALGLVVAALTHLALVAMGDPRSAAAAGLAVAVAVTDAALGAWALRGWRLRTVRAAVAVNAAFAGAWLVLRAVVPASPPGRHPAPAGVLTIAAMLSAAVAAIVLAREMGPPRPRSVRGARAWGALAAGAFAGVFLVSSGALSFVSVSGPAPSLHVAVPQVSSVSLLDVFGFPLVYGRVAPHVWLVASVWTLVFAAGAAGFLAADVALRLRPRVEAATAACARGRLGAVVPAGLGVSSCCGPSMGILLGTTVMGALYRFTPWVLAATVVALAFDIRRLRWPPPPAPSRMQQRRNA